MFSLEPERRKTECRGITSCLEPERRKIECRGITSCLVIRISLSCWLIVSGVLCRRMIIMGIMTRRKHLVVTRRRTPVSSKSRSLPVYLIV